MGQIILWLFCWGHGTTWYSVVGKEFSLKDKDVCLSISFFFICDSFFISCALASIKDRQPLSKAMCHPNTFWKRIKIISVKGSRPDTQICPLCLLRLGKFFKELALWQICSMVFGLKKKKIPLWRSVWVTYITPQIQLLIRTLFLVFRLPFCLPICREGVDVATYNHLGVSGEPRYRGGRASSFFWGSEPTGHGLWGMESKAAQRV